MDIINAGWLILFSVSVVYNRQKTQKMVGLPLLEGHILEDCFKRWLRREPFRPVLLRYLFHWWLCLLQSRARELDRLAELVFQFGFGK